MELIYASYLLTVTVAVAYVVATVKVASDKDRRRFDGLQCKRFWRRRIFAMMFSLLITLNFRSRFPCVRGFQPRRISATTANCRVRLA